MVAEPYDDAAILIVDDERSIVCLMEELHTPATGICEARATHGRS